MPVPGAYYHVYLQSLQTQQFLESAPHANDTPGFSCFYLNDE